MSRGTDRVRRQPQAKEDPGHQQPPGTEEEPRPLQRALVPANSLTSGFSPLGLRQSASLVPGLPHLWHVIRLPQETETIVTPVFRVRTVGPRARRCSTQRQHHRTGGQAHGASLASRVRAHAWPGAAAHLITGPAATQEEAVRIRIRSPTVTRFGYL